jgi:putative ABC transport system permease protein
MLRNYFVVAFRNLFRQKGLSFISLFGLSLAIACFILFLLYSLNEFSFDGFHHRAADIYRVYNGNTTWKKNKDQGSIFTPMPLGPAMKQDLPDVQQYVRYIQSFETYLKIAGEPTRENIAFADPSFFSVFSFGLRSGNTSSALQDLHSAVLTEETARRLFGTRQAVGKTLSIKVLDNDFETFTVTAVAEDLPANSYFGFNILVNFDVFKRTTEGKRDDGNWSMNSFQTFVLLKPASRLPDDARQLSAFRQKYNPQQKAPLKGQNPPLFALQPLTKMHTDITLGNIFNVMKVPPVDPTYIWILLSVAGGVLLIACINFTTLAMGRSAGRAKEIGVRKVIGGSKGALRRQFLIEAYLLTAVAAGLGLAGAWFLLPFFNEMAGRSLTFSFRQYPLLPVLLILLVFIVGLIAGGYPAIILSRFRPMEVLKSGIRLGRSNGLTRILVTGQFVISIGLIIATVIIVQQLHYLQSKDPGFQKENVVVLKAQNIPGTINIYPLLKQELAGRPEILGVTAADKGLGQREGLSIEGFDYEGRSLTVYTYGVDTGYVPVLGMQLLAGRNFDARMATDTLRSVLINATMAEMLGWTPEKAIGRQLKGMHSGDTASPPVVIGVIKDVNFQSMNARVEPQMIHQFGSWRPQRFFVRIRPGDPAPVLSAIAAAWKKAVPDYPLKYNFLQEDLDRFYTAETRLGHIIGWAGGVAIFLACLGLLGLAALAAVNRTKEIGVRKLLGASVFRIVTLITRDFILLVALAFLIATPIVWYGMSKWLEGFYFRIHLEWWVFALAGVLCTSLAWLTIAALAAKAGRANPVKSLRTE